MYTCSGYTHTEKKDTLEVDSVMLIEQEIMLDENGNPVMQTITTPEEEIENEEVVIDLDNM